jgi:ABC-type transport system substrate-binding protein
LWAVPLAGWAQAATPAAPLKVLRISFPAPETGFDPVQVSDVYSNTAISHIFESLYGYDHLARPFKIKPRIAAAMPEVSDDFRIYTIRLRPGVLFADDPAFKGRPRELVAEDFIYTLKRHFDPKTKSPAVSNWEEEGILGLDALRDEALKAKADFNYDRPIAGLKALDRHTLQIKLAQPRPRLLYKLADMPIMAREVVEAYGEHIMEHPVGTGPYKLTQWRRSSLMVFERNPTYREVHYDAEPNADDAEGQALLQRLKGRRLPMIDRVEVGVVEQGQPRWLAFLNGEFDILGVPLEFATVAAPKGKLAPNLEKRGVRMHRVLAPDVTMVYFNMEDPVVGGYTPDKVALRRAISLGTNVEREIRLARRGQAIPAQSGMVPHTYGFDPDYKSENSEYNVSKAQALLDLYGYIDRDGDGWRDQPDGKPLALDYATQPDAISRQFDELWAKNMDALRIRLVYKVGKWPEQLKQARAGKLMLWQLGSSATSPDGQGALELAYGPSAGGGNLARFKLAAFDEIYRKINDAPDGPERQALFTQANKLITAYMPYKFHVHRIGTDLTHPWVVGYRRPTFWRDTWQYMDLEPKP